MCKVTDSDSLAGGHTAIVSGKSRKPILKWVLFHRTASVVQLDILEAKMKGHIQLADSSDTSFEVSHVSKRENNMSSGKQADMT